MARLLVLRSQFVIARQLRAYSDSSQMGELGKGAGKGGGGGGSIREAGGAFGKREAAIEEKYFREKEMEQIENLRKHHQEEINHHEQEIQRLQSEIKRHKSQIKKLKHDGYENPTEGWRQAIKMKKKLHLLPPALRMRVLTSFHVKNHTTPGCRPTDLIGSTSFRSIAPSSGGQRSKGQSASN